MAYGRDKVTYSYTRALVGACKRYIGGTQARSYSSKGKQEIAKPCRGRDDCAVSENLKMPFKERKSVSGLK